MFWFCLRGHGRPGFVSCDKCPIYGPDTLLTNTPNTHTHTHPEFVNRILTPWGGCGPKEGTYTWVSADASRPSYWRASIVLPRKSSEAGRLDHVSGEVQVGQGFTEQAKLTLEAL